MYILHEGAKQSEVDHTRQCKRGLHFPVSFWFVGGLNHFPVYIEDFVFSNTFLACLFIQEEF